jgi:hypothetical protein
LCRLPKEEVNDMEKLRKSEGLSLEELEAQRVELLPDREEMQKFGDVTFGDITTGDQLAVQVQGVQAIVVPAA